MYFMSVRQNNVKKNEYKMIYGLIKRISGIQFGYKNKPVWFCLLFIFETTHRFVELTQKYRF